jgi:hypothetical protein
MHPYGCLEYKRTYYEGSFMLNMQGLDGTGTMEFGDGSVYEGYFRSGKPRMLLIIRYYNKIYKIL